ncbi:MAG TPA: 50S ribosomal protein L29 [Candidatus Borkfalkia faecigallinarum]|uniref:Large ribosomal subunit protein uL29 n=1 Tax=Candidatus Borkfalkia faecigallinarum TaxID=2838509 RepID=A0A9D1VTY2_9FIRM|nr:50S ribosomal protein L29 [Candidatus Borkfalkia faecigallinarum]
MKGNELHNMTDEELQKKLGELKSELFNLRFRHASGQLDNPMSIVSCKRDIARVNTVIRARQLRSRA